MSSTRVWTVGYSGPKTDADFLLLEEIPDWVYLAELLAVWFFSSWIGGFGWAFNLSHKVAQWTDSKTTVVKKLPITRDQLRELDDFWGLLADVNEGNDD